jgi:hypothetical protein
VEVEEVEREALVAVIARGEHNLKFTGLTHNFEVDPAV